MEDDDEIIPYIRLTGGDRCPIIDHWQRFVLFIKTKLLLDLIVECEAKTHLQSLLSAGNKTTTKCQRHYRDRLLPAVIL